MSFSMTLALPPSAAPVVAQPAVSLTVRSVEYTSEAIEVHAILAVPRAGGPHPGVLFIHGRSGWHNRLRTEALRLAERGFVVLAPDCHTGRFIPENPVAHDPATEQDVERGIDYLTSAPGVRAGRIGMAVGALMPNVRRAEAAAAVTAGFAGFTLANLRLWLIGPSLVVAISASESRR